MDRRKSRIAGLALFALLLSYFIYSYGYYPGLQLRFSGDIERDASGNVSWDYGYGFNTFDTIPFTISARSVADREPLGRIRIEPAGFKPEASRGYMFWLVVPRNILESKMYSVEGKHHWGFWMPCGKTDGRQLALFSGSFVEFDVADPLWQLYLFKTPQSGYGRIRLENGFSRYTNGYGTNERNLVTPLPVAKESSGEIKHVRDFYRNKDMQSILLPRQKIEAVRVDLSEREIRQVTPHTRLRIESGDDDRQGREHSAVVEKILVNGKQVDMADSSVTFSGVQDDKRRLMLTGEGDYIEFSGEIYSYDLTLVAGESKRAINISLDGKTVNSSGAPDERGLLTLSGTAPSRPFGQEINAIKAVDWQGKVVEIPRQTDNSFVLEGDLAGLQQRKLHWLLLTVQVVTAGGVTLMIMAICRYCMALRRRLTPASLPAALFLMEGRWLFWGMLLLGATVNFLFLLAEWPGSLTPDSIDVLKQVRWLEFTNHHPYLYSLGLLALLNIYDSTLFLVIVQLLVFHCFSATIFYWFYKNGLALPLLLPCYLLCVFSLPINYLNITLWKDIPFAIFILFWALFLTLAVHRRLHEGKEVQISTAGFLLLAMTFVFLCTIRHNGLVYIPVIIAAMIWLFRQQWAGSRWFLGASVVMFVCYFLILPSIVLVHKPKQNNYAMTETSRKTGDLRKIISGQQENVYLEDYLGERAKIFFRTLGVSPHAWIWNNDMNNPPQRWFSVDEARAEMRKVTISPLLSSWNKKLLDTLEYSGVFRGRFVFWNCLFFLIAMTGAVFLARWFPLSAFYSAFYLYQTAVMFVVVWPRWRYMYYLYLGGVFLVPVFLFELQRKHWWTTRIAGGFRKTATGHMMPYSTTISESNLS